jgi:hypothetical protein
MSTKSERERRRAERLAAEQAATAAQRRRLMFGYIAAGALTLAVVVGLVLALSGGDDTADPTADLPANAHIEPLSGSLHDLEPDGREGTTPPALQQGDLAEAAKAAGCELQLDLEQEGDQHITKESEIPEYKTSPPASGNHHPEQLADGAYATFPEPWYFIHSLEHGRIEIQYSPDLSEEDQLAIKGVFDESPDGMLLFPNPDMPYEVAATAWTQLIGCDSFEGDATLDAIRDFRDTYRGRGPENVPIQLSG